MTAPSGFSFPKPDINPLRLQHSSYDLENYSFATVYEVADTLEDYFSLARQSQLDEKQLTDVLKFINNLKVLNTANSVVPEIHKMIKGSEGDEVDSGTEVWSSQVTRLVNSVRHLKDQLPKHNGPTSPEEIQAEHDQTRAELMDVLRAVNEKQKAEEEELRQLAANPGLCNWEECEKPASQQCGKCKKVFYCSKECQRSDWKAGHKDWCLEPLLKVHFNIGKPTTIGDMIRSRGDAGRLSWMERHGRSSHV